MSKGIQTILFPVENADATKALFIKLLGADPIADTPYYVGFEVAGQSIGLVPGGHKQGMPGPVAYIHVDDIKASRQQMLDAGGETVVDVRDVGNGRLVATVKDAEGNVFGLLQDA